MSLLWIIVTISSVLWFTIVMAGVLLHQSNKRLLQATHQNKQDHTPILDFIQRSETTQHLVRQQVDHHQMQTLKLIQDCLQNALTEIRTQVSVHLEYHTKALGDKVSLLTQETERQLNRISGQMENQLQQSFAKTTATFHDILKRLTVIDQAQQQINDLSSHVIGLQEILSDKRSRGTFGEVQLNALIRNVLPENSFSLQHSLSNHKRVDCILFLPEPTGNVVIDAKFPLETYRLLQQPNLTASEQQLFMQQFRQDMKHHIRTIAEKYIIPGETADGAILFIPAEAIFAEIHAHYPEIVEVANQARVWLTSPTTLMAILTTARAVLKDAATRQQVHIIQEHLIDLSKDFQRFQQRMDNLARHVRQAHEDVELVHKSSHRISKRFHKIETVELDNVELEKHEQTAELLSAEDEVDVST